jgi:hypothetical protein
MAWRPVKGRRIYPEGVKRLIVMPITAPVPSVCIFRPVASHKNLNEILFVASHKNLNISIT